MNNVLDLIFSTDFLFTTIRVMTPILFAALACMIFTKGGIDSIGTEGIMLMCSLAGVLGSHYTQNPFLGMLTAVIVGSLLACLFGYVTLSLKSEPVLAGIALNTLASGLTIFIIYYVTGEKGSTQSLMSPTLPNIHIPLLKDMPILGSILSGHNFITYLGLLLTVVLALFIYKTPTGLRIRSVGENPDAAKSIGIKVYKYKYIALIIAGALAGLGGSFMSMGYVSFFSKEMVAGRGFIGMAAESMGRGTPIGVLLSSLLFGAADSLAIRLQMLNLPVQLIQTIPYVVTIIAIAIYSYSRTEKKISK
ncbi:ABC transporter permease [Paratissierella segnis]|jgi:simple sugar transport system permease protein|uniref:ABC transporter permease n=1 Tax=Paratissierella segnis TaxID=2763679 RepID=A0A926EUW6_9FIRM|nr:ABC transporter permease [Paratissierella segnis]MBC8588950.1 ABC transporter permease [Paratissierella segnis]